MSIVVAYPRPEQLVRSRFFIAQGVYKFPKRVVAVMIAKNNQDLMYTGVPFGVDRNKYWRRAFSHVEPGNYRFLVFDARDYENTKLEFDVRSRMTSLPPNAAPTIDYPLPNTAANPYPLGASKEFTAFGSTGAAALIDVFCRCFAMERYIKPVAETVDPMTQSWSVELRGNPADPENPHVVHVDDVNGFADSDPVHFTMAVVGGNGPIMMKSRAPARSSGKKRAASKKRPAPKRRGARKSRA